MAEQTQDDVNEPALSATLLNAWKRRRGLALDCLVVPLAIGFAVAIFLPNVYRSVALVEVAHEGQTTADASSPASVEGQLERLNEENLSRAHLQQLITRFDLYPALLQKGAIEGAIDQLRKDVTIEIKDSEHVWGRSTVAFQVAFRGAEPERVAQVTNALASFYVEKSQQQGEAMAKEAVASLQTQVDETKARLDAQEKAVNDFLSLHLQELPDQVRVNLAQIDRLNAQLASLNHSGRGRAFTPAQLQQDPAAAVAEEAPDAELVRLTDQLSELRGRVTDQYPDVVHLKQQIAALQAASRRRALQPRPAPLQSNALIAAPQIEEELPPRRSNEDQKRQIRAQIAALQASVYSAPKREVEMQALTAPLAATRLTYNGLLEKLQDARRGDTADKQRALDPFRVLDPAIASRAAAGPNRIKIAGAGIFVSILIALLAVFLAEKLDTSFHSIDELRAFTRVPVLVSVPNIVTAGDTARLRNRAWVAALIVVFVAITGVAASYVLVRHNTSLVTMFSRGHA